MLPQARRAVFVYILQVQCCGFLLPWPTICRELYYRPNFCIDTLPGVALLPFLPSPFVFSKLMLPLLTASVLTQKGRDSLTYDGPRLSGSVL